MQEIKVEAEEKLNSARMSEREKAQNLALKTSQMESDYIRIQDHETIVNSKMAEAKKQHELESAELA